MPFTWPDPIGFFADIVSIFGIPVLIVSTINLYREAKKARTPQIVSYGCLDFNDVEEKCGVNLVPLERVTAIPRIGDQVYLPGETHDFKPYGRGYYEVLKVVFGYSEAPEINQPCPALPAKIVVHVRKIRKQARELKGEHEMFVKSLTPVERLQLINQFRILEKLYPENAKDYAESREIIAHGYTIQYEREVFGEVWEEMDIEECKYVFDVLDMHRTLIQSYDALTDKKGLTPDNVRFRGFDGNNESKCWAFTEHLKKQGLWVETLTGGVNSHFPTKARYVNMLKKFEPIKEKILESHTGNWDLTAEQIREIIS